MKKVLIVVGYKQNGHLLSTILTRFGYEVIVANGLRDGLDVFNRNGAEIFMAITEYRIPQIADGVIFCKAVKKIAPANPVVLVSSSFDDLDGVRCLHPEADFDYFIRKPLSSILIIPRIVERFASQEGLTL